MQQSDIKLIIHVLLSEQEYEDREHTKSLTSQEENHQSVCSLVVVNSSDVSERRRGGGAASSRLLPR